MQIWDINDSVTMSFLLLPDYDAKASFWEVGTGYGRMDSNEECRSGRMGKWTGNPGKGCNLKHDEFFFIFYIPSP